MLTHCHCAPPQSVIPQVQPSPPGNWDVAFRPLTTEESETVSETLETLGNLDETIAEVNNVPISRESMLTLCEHQWLNDEVPHSPPLRDGLPAYKPSPPLPVSPRVSPR